MIFLNISVKEKSPAPYLLFSFFLSIEWLLMLLFYIIMQWFISFEYEKSVFVKILPDSSIGEIIVWPVFFITTIINLQQNVCELLIEKSYLYDKDVVCCFPFNRLSTRQVSTCRFQGMQKTHSQHNAINTDLWPKHFSQFIFYSFVVPTQIINNTPPPCNNKAGMHGHVLYFPYTT